MRSKRLIPIVDYCLACGHGREMGSPLAWCAACKRVAFVPSLEFVKWADLMRLFDKRFLKAMHISSD